MLNFEGIKLIYRSYGVALLIVLIILFSATKYWGVAHELMMLASLGGFFFVKQHWQHIAPEILKIGYLILLFVMLVSLYVVWSYEENIRFSYNFGNIKFFIVYFGLALLLTQWRLSIDSTLKIIILLPLYSVVFNIGILLDDPVRTEGWLRGPIPLGNLGMMLGLMALAAIFGVKEKTWKVIGVILGVSGILLSIQSGTRGGWLALVIAIPTLLYFLYGFLTRKQQILTWLVGIIFILGIAVIWQYLPIMDRISLAVREVNDYIYNPSVEGHFGSVGLRLEMWRSIIEDLPDYWLFGHGLTAFSDFFHLRMIELYGTEDYYFNHAHNDYLFILFHFGLLGLMLMLSLLGYMLFVLYRNALLYKKRKQEQQVVLLLVALVALESVMEFMLSDINFMHMPFMVALIVVTLALQLTKIDSIKKVKANK